MTFDELYILGYNSVVRVVNYVVEKRDKRIYFVYLLSSLFLAYYVYHNLKLKYSFFKYIFSKKVWLSQSSFVDYFMIFFNSFIKALLIGPYVYYGLYLAYHTDEYLSHTFGLIDNELSKSQIMVLYTIALTLANDFSTYVVHLVMHKIPFLWEFHKIHHSATVLNPITQYRIHPIELIINNAKAIFVFGITMGVFDYLSIHQINEWQFLGANVFSFVFLFWGANLRHSHVKLKYFTWIENIFISPYQHQIHHSNNKAHFDKNMGAKLAIWDLLFGTLLKSKDVKTLEFGLGKEDDKNYNSFIKNLYMPFVNIINKMAGVFNK